MLLVPVNSLDNLHRARGKGAAGENGDAGNTCGHAHGATEQQHPCGAFGMFSNDDLQTWYSIGISRENCCPGLSQMSKSARKTC